MIRLINDVLLLVELQGRDVDQPCGVGPLLSSSLAIHDVDILIQRTYGPDDRPDVLKVICLSNWDRCMSQV